MGSQQITIQEDDSRFIYGPVNETWTRNAWENYDGGYTMHTCQPIAHAEIRLVGPHNRILSSWSNLTVSEIGTGVELIGAQG